MLGAIGQATRTTGVGAPDVESLPSRMGDEQQRRQAQRLTRLSAVEDAQKKPEEPAIGNKLLVERLRTVIEHSRLIETDNGRHDAAGLPAPERPLPQLPELSCHNGDHS